jgi:hypothetical protein
MPPPCGGVLKRLSTLLSASIQPEAIISSRGVALQRGHDPARDRRKRVPLVAWPRLSSSDREQGC